MITKPEKNKIRIDRHKRIRNKINGTPDRPRLSVFRSNKNMYAQLIDDVNGVTVAEASTKSIDAELACGGNIEAAKAVGKAIAERAIEAGYSEVVFDRSGYVYHGRVKELADAAREAGLKF